MFSRRNFLKAAAIAPTCGCLRTAFADGGAPAAATQIHVCTEIAMKDVEQAFAIAIDENAANDPVAQGLPRSEAISLYKKKWNPRRRVLNVSFVTEPSYLQKIITHARRWEPYIGISFKFGTSNPDILVAFDKGGSWSRIGTDCRYYASRGQVTMNYGWFDDQTDDSEFNRTVVHEFGHCLSLVHEHRHPGSNIHWNIVEVYKYYEGLGWSKSDVDEQVIGKYALQQVNGSAYDKLSIMHYPIPPEFVTDKNDVVGWNTDLSDLDKETISALYPPNVRSLP